MNILPNPYKKNLTPKLIAPKRPSKHPTANLPNPNKITFTPKLIAPKRPSKPPKKTPTPKLIAPKRPSKPPKKTPTPKLIAPKRPSKHPKKTPTPKLIAPKRPSKHPKKTPTPKLIAPKRPSKQPSKRTSKSPKNTSTKVVTSNKSPKKTSTKVVTSNKSPKKTSTKVVTPNKSLKKTSTKVVTPNKSLKKTPTQHKPWPSLTNDDIKMLQRYTIMNPRDVWGSKMNNIKDAKYVEVHVPKFKQVLDILQKDILPSSRKPLIGKALIFIKNKKDGLEALVHYLISVGKMNPVRWNDNTDNIQKGNNLLVMGEFDTKSTLYSYGVVSQKAAKNIVSKFNEEQNVIGDKYPVMIVHEKFMEGLDLNGVTHIILVQEPGVPGMFNQVVGRGVRSCSHSKYPSSMWNVKIINLTNTFDRPTPDQVLEHNRERVTHLVDKIMKTTQMYSLDCSVSSLRYGHKCV
jgi:hypothetical protein